MKKTRILLLMTLILTLAVFGAGCGAQESKPQEQPDSETTQDLPLTVGIMPAVDSAPLLLAEEMGYFDELGLAVELQLFNNPQDRQSALQTGSIDGAITDLIAVATNVDSGFDIKATTMTNGVFPVLSMEGVENKKEIKVGMMEVSVTNFLIDEWLGDDYVIEKVYINDIPARLAAIGSGQLDMGLFPEPMASMGELNGLKKLLFQPEGGFCPDVIVFTGKALEEKEEAIRLFHQAYNLAVEEINKDPEAARNIIMEKIPNLNPAIKDSIIFPQYTKASIPDDEYLEKIIQWTSEAMKKDLQVSPEDLVERKFEEK